MRARYAAYVLGETDFVFRSWHPRTRPSDLTTGAGPTWTGLRVLEVVDGGAEDPTGTVEFAAAYTSVDGTGVLHERSRFARRAGAWVYVDGDVL
jgi:SEC-C motif-containing protein